MNITSSLQQSQYYIINLHDITYDASAGCIRRQITVATCIDGEHQRKQSDKTKYLTQLSNAKAYILQESIISMFTKKTVQPKIIKLFLIKTNKKQCCRGG